MDGNWQYPTEQNQFYACLGDFYNRIVYCGRVPAKMSSSGLSLELYFIRFSEFDLAGSHTIMAPNVGHEPTTLRLRVSCSTD